MDPTSENRVREIFNRANFIRDLGIELVRVEDGICETILVPSERHLQQHGLIHAGVLATMADHTAGGAAGSILGGKGDVLSIEFKINFLRPAIADRLRCYARVLRGGKTIVVAESEIFAAKEGQEKLVSKATVTLAVREI
ncbi:MAG TPA: PaaI family thioesterase [Terriglobales bacterium]|nr:PaaI family thioesterase [Terriglobales bacterium]